MKLPFVKMHGLGNDFVVIDERRQSFALAPAQLAALADRRTGIGCDQILFMEGARSRSAAIRYRVANADGSPAEHCGNGIRCVAHLLQRQGEVTNRVDIEVGSNVFELTFEDRGQVRVEMGAPKFAPVDIPLAVSDERERYQATLNGREFTFGAVSMGNPHAVLEVESSSNADVFSIGTALQNDPLFPASVNVGFMQVLDGHNVQLRVFERGVGETRACGTGACAAVAVGRRWGRLAQEVAVGLSGGTLTIEWDGHPDHALWMTGPATYVFEGVVEI